MRQTRRRFLTLAGAGTIALAGCTGGDGGGGGGGSDGSDGGGQSPTATPAPTEEPTATGTPAPTATADATVTVGPGGDLSFDPDTLEVDAGATVRWEWDSGGHTVTPESIPDDSDWAGTGQTTHSTGHVHVHAFEATGRYDYVCVPHEGAGMTGTLFVGVTPTETSSGSGETTTAGSGGGSDGGDGGYY